MAGEYRAAQQRGSAPPLVDFLAEHADLQPELGEALQATASAVADLSADAPADPVVPAPLPGYRDLEHIGSGGQGQVFAAVQKRTGQAVAIKFLNHSSPVHEQRFQREIELAARLQHPNIVPIYDSGRSASGQLYYVMRRLDACSLSTWQTETHPDTAMVVTQMVRIARATQFAHEHGIVHRDLKPSNILVDRHGQPHLVDFGLAKDINSDEPALSQTDDVFGTLNYMAPEQARGAVRERVERIDVYALGVILFELLSGQVPIDTQAPQREALRRIEENEPPALRRIRPGLHRDLETICAQALQKDPERRYVSVEELADDLERYLAGEPIDARRDSVFYVTHKRVQRTIARNRSLALVAVVPLVFALSQWVVQPVLIRSGLEAPYYTALQTLVPRSPTEQFDHVFFVKVTDATSFSQLSEEFGIQGLSDVRTTHRALYGHLARVLADSDARSIVFDMSFVGVRDADNAFRVGLRNAAAMGIPSFAAEPTWMAPSSVSSVIAPNIRTGCTTSTLTDGQTWTVDLALARGDELPQPSLALLGIAGWLDGASRLQLDPIGSGKSLRLRFIESSSRTSGIETLTASRFGTPKQTKHGMRVDDRLYQLVMLRPHASAYQNAACEIGAFLRMSDDARNTLVRDRVVVVLHDSTSVPTVPAIGGPVPRGTATGTAIDVGLGHMLSVHSWSGWNALGLLLAATFGVAAGLFQRSALVLTGTTMLFLFLCIAVAILWQRLWSPTLIVACIWVAGGLARSATGSTPR